MNDGKYRIGKIVVQKRGFSMGSGKFTDPSKAKNVDDRGESFRCESWFGKVAVESQTR
jgi:hypothetical protein